MSCLQPLVVCSCLEKELIGFVEVVGVSSDPSSLGFLTVADRAFGFLATGGGQGLQLFAPGIGQAICSFISWNTTMGWDPL